MTLGYSVAAHLRDLYYDPTLFVVVGVVVGPFVGIAASWLRTASWRATTGTALLSGIGLGEATYGLTVVADTTSPVYWTLLVGVLAIALLVTMLIHRIRGVLWSLLAVVETGVIAGGFLVAYSSLGEV